MRQHAARVNADALHLVAKRLQLLQREERQVLLRVGEERLGARAVQRRRRRGRGRGGLEARPAEARRGRDGARAGRRGGEGEGAADRGRGRRAIRVEGRGAEREGRDLGLGLQDALLRSVSQYAGCRAAEPTSSRLTGMPIATRCSLRTRDLRQSSGLSAGSVSSSASNLRLCPSRVSSAREQCARTARAMGSKRTKIPSRAPVPGLRPASLARR